MARATTDATDSLPEWSKGVDSSSTSESCVGSNPTAVIMKVSQSAKRGRASALRAGNLGVPGASPSAAAVPAFGQGAGFPLASLAEAAVGMALQTAKTLPGRLELPTLRLTASRSNQLS